MGKCLPSHRSGSVSAELMASEDFIMVMRSDGKIMEFTVPLLVRDLIAAYPQHSVVHSEDGTCRSLSPDKKLVPGQLYRLLLIPKSPSLSKDVVLSESKIINNSRLEGRISRERRASTRLPSSVQSLQNGSGIIRVKMVISKKELEAFLSECSKNDKSVEEGLIQLQCKAKEGYVAKRSSGRWRPLLQSIAEEAN